MKKVLVVDDSAMSRRILRTILEEEGLQVVEASDGMVALEQYFLEKPDVVMLDLVMAGMYGLDVLPKLKELDPLAVVVVATADIQSSTRQMAVDAGAFRIVTKPFVPVELVTAVHAALEERSSALNRQTK